MKTRLAAGIGARAACAVYKCFLDATVKRVSSIPGIDVLLFFTPDTAEAAAYFSREYRVGECAAQADGDLGAKMNAAFQRAFSAGCGRCCVIGTDIPDLPPDYVLESFRALDDNDLALGPCPDGGYYLIGLRAPAPLLFEGIPWSTPDVLDETLKNADSGNMRRRLLPEWRDVDDCDDLDSLMARLADSDNDQDKALLAEIERALNKNTK